MQSKDGGSSVNTKSIDASNADNDDEEDTNTHISSAASQETSRSQSTQRLVLDEDSQHAEDVRDEMSTEQKHEEHVDVHIVNEEPVKPSTFFQMKTMPGELSLVLFGGISNFAKLIRYCWAVVQTEDGVPFPEEQASLMEVEEEIKEQLVRFMSEYLEYSLLPDFRVAKFFCEWIEFPSRAIKNHAFKLAEWKGILDLLAFSLKSDFDRLQDWR